MQRKTDGLYERKDSPYWWASYVNGQDARVRRSTHIRTETGIEGRREAEALLSKWRTESHQERMWGREKLDTAPSRTFDEVIESYLVGRGIIETFGKSRLAYIVRNLHDEFAGRAMDSIAALDVKKYVRRRMEKVGASTVNKELCLFSAACNWAKFEEGWEVPNPALGQKPKEPRGRVRWLKHWEAERLIREAGKIERAPWLADYVQLSLNTGLRKGDITAITWDRVDLAAKQIYIPGRGTNKSQAGRYVPLNAGALEALEGRLRFRNEHCPESPWVFSRQNGKRVQDMKKSFATARRNAGIEDFRQHDQRHCFGSWLVQADVPLKLVSEALGHASVRTTEIYTHVNPSAVRESVDKIGCVRSGHVWQNRLKPAIAKVPQSAELH